MTRAIRSLIITAALFVLAALSLFAWGAWLNDFIPGISKILQSPSLSEQFVFIGLSAPVLMCAGGLAFWLYEPRQRTIWVLLFASSLGALLAFLAPTILLHHKPVVLAFYWLGIGALTAFLVLSGSWAAAVLAGRLQRRKLETAA